MKKLLLMMALAAAMTVQANELNDTTVIRKADMVTITTSDTVQKIDVVGKEGDAGYRYEKKVPLNAYKMRRQRKSEEKYVGWSPNFDLGVGVNTPLGVSDGYGFATFRSWDLFFGLALGYTPEKKLQTYTVGLWLNWKSYGLSTDRMLAKDGNHEIWLAEYPTGSKDRGSRINTFSLQVPFLFTQKLGHKSKCKLTFGPVVNFNVYGRLNSHYTINDNEHDVSTKGIKYNIVTVDLLGAFHYKGVALYCKYSPMSVIKKDKGPKFQTLTFGVWF